MILDQKVPLVTVDRYCEGLDADYVGVDNYEAAKSAMQQLLSEGFRRVSMVRLDLDIPPLNERERGYVDAMREAGLESNIDIHRIRFGEGQEEDLSNAKETLLAADAVFYTSHRVFTEAMIMASREGGIPAGQCVLCFDDVRPYMNGNSDIRYVEQPVADIARKSFELLAKIHGETSNGRYVFPTRCVNRNNM